MGGRHQVLDLRDVEQSPVMLVLSSAGVCSATLGRLAVAEVQRTCLLRGTVSLASEHDGLHVLSADRTAWGYLSLRNIGDRGPLRDPLSQ